MKKIPTVFARDPENRKFVLPEITPGCEWVLAGEGVPTRKMDGTCCAVIAGVMYKRQERKTGGISPELDEWILVDTDDFTGKSIYWAPVGDGSEDRWHREAWDYAVENQDCDDGTYELLGPKINGNPEHYDRHTLLAHDYAQDLLDIRPLLAAPSVRLLFVSLESQLTDPGFTYEGVAWHHEDGRMAKLKRRDFPRP